MGEKTEIAWCHSTFNPWIGCQRVAVGCEHCYAEAFAKRTGKAKWGPQGTRVKTSPSNWKLPFKWNRLAETTGEDWRVFCASMADVFEKWTGSILHHGGLPLHRGAAWKSKEKYVARDLYVGKSLVTLDDLRADLFSMIDQTAALDWMLLTKRPENIPEMWPAIDREHADTRTLLANHFRAVDARIEAGGHLNSAPSEHVAFQTELGRLAYRPNVWLGTSIATQADADRNVPLLRKCRELSPVLFLSCEPLVEAVTLDLEGIDLVIVGGESGHGARACRPEWIRSIVGQCKAAGVACFVKQLGANIVTRNDMVEDTFSDGECGWPDAEVEHHINGFREDYQGADCRVRLHDKKGGDWSEWPEDIRVREFPKLETAR